MAGKETLTLMFQDREVLLFEADYAKWEMHIRKELEHFDKAPYDVIHGQDKDHALLHFFFARAIPSTRIDYDKILKATGAGNGFELSFRGHGLSLSNHYWFKREGERLHYEDINFFHNGWDDTFGKAVLSGDYETLGKCDLNVPDIVTAGWGVKGWLSEDKPRLYKLGIDEEHPEEAICEVLASRIGRRLLGKGEVVSYELKKINGRFASVSESLIGEGEELIPMSSILPPELVDLYRNNQRNKEFSREFFRALEGSKRKDLYDFFVKVYCLRSLCFISDLHTDNLCAIRNVDSGEVRVAPIMDLGGAFGSTKSGRDTIAKANRGTLFIIYFLFSNLDPKWDYSWYDPRCLDGAEEEIEEYLAKSSFYTPDIIRCVLNIYRQQKKTLDEMKEGNP